MNLGALTFWVLLSSLTYTTAREVLHLLDPDQEGSFETTLPDNYWLYNITVVLATVWEWFSCLLFLDVAIADYSRRNMILNELTNALELDFEKKDANSVRYPTINFCDPMSLKTWLMARRLAFDLGGRFTIRIHYFVLYFLALAQLLLLASFAYLADIYLCSDLKPELVIQLGVYGFVVNAYVLRILLVASDLNEQTMNQIKSLVNIQE